MSNEVNSKYDVTDLTSLEKLEPVRIRPGMYIGSTGTKGLHHCIWEILDNSIDEISNGFGNKATIIINEVNNIKSFDEIKTISKEEAIRDNLLTYVGEEVDKAYLEQVKSLTIRRELVEKNAKDLKVIYTPIHGTGNIPVRRVLKELGYEQVQVVKEQELPDGNFPTAPYPNPEDPQVFEIALDMAKTSNPDIIFGTDPDCDRIGVVVKDSEGNYRVLNGNQTGLLLTEYILSALKEENKLPENGVVIKTIVTTEGARAIATHYGIEIMDVLTGFKYIGEKIREFQEAGDRKYLFGFEESYGYLAGEFVRDKDAVIASMLIAEMTLFYKQQGKSLYDGLIDLYNKYGFFKEKTISITLKGIEGLAKIKDIISYFRENEVSSMGDFKVIDMKDYSKGVDGLPKADVLKFFLEDGSWVAIRPSGTEPKLKFYIAVKGIDENEATNKLNNINKYIDSTINSLVIENKEAASKLFC